MKRQFSLLALAAILCASATPAEAGPSVFWTFGFDFRPSNVRTNPAGDVALLQSPAALDLNLAIISTLPKPQHSILIAVHDPRLALQPHYALAEVSPVG